MELFHCYTYDKSVSYSYSVLLLFIFQWVGTKQKEFQANSMQLLYYQVEDSG